MAKRYLWVVEAKRNGKWAHVNDCLGASVGVVHFSRRGGRAELRYWRSTMREMTFRLAPWVRYSAEDTREAQ